MFRRRRSAESEAEEADDLDLDEETAEQAASDAGRPTGPWDAADAPHDETPRIDLGSLQVPAADGIELRVDMQDNVVVNATLVDGRSAMQIHAFAAPRSSGIWDDVRTEIATSLRESGGSAEVADGPFGPELHARVPAPPPDQGGPPGGGTQPMRFVGVDGPRWFLRGLLTGPAATDAHQARRLLDVFRGTVVVRGGEAMAPREMLPLRLPKEAMAHQPGDHPPETESQRPGLEMLERGPEITETR